ncbi:hypothetical protein KIN20_027162 [Parelaphostrongylus tenuis]|uniref:Uncharacterized protein n=1 Tax=Parelaphostrongylus tenuis TaxID=148309 RepID=A0AAD5WDL2_PARTN|nr:hypothetical protein KIN20_027162 [Parelaphostrongylus tenuis]
MNRVIGETCGSDEDCCTTETLSKSLFSRLFRGKKSINKENEHNGIGTGRAIVAKLWTDRLMLKSNPRGKSESVTTVQSAKVRKQRTTWDTSKYRSGDPSPLGNYSWNSHYNEDLEDTDDQEWNMHDKLMV